MLTKHDQPFGFLRTVLVGLRVTEGFPVDVSGFVDLVLCTVTDKDRLATPLDDHLFIQQIGTVRY